MADPINLPVPESVSHRADTNGFFHTLHELTALFWLAGLEGFYLCFTLCARFARERLAAQWVRQQELTVTHKMRLTFQWSAFLRHLLVPLAASFFHAFFFAAVANV